MLPGETTVSYIFYLQLDAEYGERHSRKMSICKDIFIEEICSLKCISYSANSNIILDVLNKRENHESAAKIFDLCERRKK